MRQVTAHRLLLLAAPLLAGVAPTTRPAQSSEAVEVKQTIRFLQYLPPDYESDPENKKNGDGRGWPLMLFLHGAGERGTNIDDVKRQGLPKRIARGDDFPFIVISPQVDPGLWWNGVLLLKLLDEMERTLKVDPDRIYVTGLSMGGFGTFEVALLAPDRFAAIAPICGGGQPALARLVPGLKTLPVWAFHGDKDDIVPLRFSQDMIDTLTKLGNKEAKLTIYPGVGHDSWTRTYDDPGLYRWLLSHKRR